jgi:hypothetical protein
MPRIRLRDPKESFPVGAVPSYGATPYAHQGDDGSYAIHFTVGQSFGEPQGTTMSDKTYHRFCVPILCLLSNRESAQFGLIPNHHDVPVGEDKPLVLEFR